MNTKAVRWLPIALCCLPGVAVAALVGIGFAVGGAAFGASFGGPLGLGLIALAVLACPLSMVWMMGRGSQRKPATGSASVMADCCAPGEQAPATDSAGSNRLAILRSRREALERELAELQREQRA